MVFSQFHLDSCDHHRIPAYRWSVEHPRGAVLILHGMSEHGQRYARFAEALNKAGYTVMAIDHRGHGPDTPELELGTFAHERGWEKVVEDVDYAWDHLHSFCPGVPLFIFGHSMGSFITQSWLMRKPHHLTGALLSGSNFAPRLLLKLGNLATLIESYRIGRTGCSKLVDTLTFGSYNNAFKPVRTQFDWLSRDSAEVDAYIADKLCGFQCTNGLWLDLFHGLLSISSVSALKKIDSRLPLYITGGDQDPVGQAGKGLQKLADSLSSAGITDITCDIWPNGRHEMLNETNRDEVTAKLLVWLEHHTPDKNKLQMEPEVTQSARD
ncbi:alpha/beta hydrolase [Parendozoicomonas sp. Alg238-R29]|uniref:alpha/beta hydrolase n=1 Tax=Parendozoicomonas sp. Alg238-R29 TaxID=2993446 RepID=UPI00248D6C96|nr:alpha/beta hydrolase [Parendozoicomonas sp. Alg238-R29]